MTNSFVDILKWISTHTNVHRLLNIITKGVMSMKLLKSELKILNSKDNKDYSIDDYRRQQEKALYQSKTFFRNHQF